MLESFEQLLNSIKNQLYNDLSTCSDIDELYALKGKYVGRENSYRVMTLIMQKNAKQEDKKDMSRIINDFWSCTEDMLEEKMQTFQKDN